jgi:hypothetical protein
MFHVSGRRNKDAKRDWETGKTLAKLSFVSGRFLCWKNPLANPHSLEAITIKQSGGNIKKKQKKDVLNSAFQNFFPRAHTPVTRTRMWNCRRNFEMSALNGILH